MDETFSTSIDIRRDFSLSKLKFARRFISGLGQFTGELRNDPSSDYQRYSSIIYKLRSRFDSYKVLLETVKGDPADPLSQKLVSSMLALAKELETAILTHSSINDHKIKNEIISEEDDLFPSSLNTKNLITLDAQKEASRFYSVQRKKTEAYSAALNTVQHTISWIETLRENSTPENKITREISFPPELQQAGIGILSYFSRVLQANYPDLDIGVTIQQIGDSVTMVITHPDGTREEITRTLHEYGLVVTGKMRAEDLVHDPIQAMALKQKLELTELELRQTREILTLQRTYSEERIKSLESDVSRLYGMLEQKLGSDAGVQEQLIKLAGEQGERSTDLISAVLELSKALQSRDGTQAQLMLEDIAIAKPDLFTRLTDFFYSSAVSGVIGNTAFSWLIALWPTLPK
ncbi:hypothetical protein BLA9940_05847 [Burkholderia aenigmatica]|uniref:hypothetical protein n=1 Tax=Burkholderia cepacia complex TaxID=87882 RepID=UPI0013DE4640|nr:MULTISPECIES: hypothetical protein [Burkholderia cepacia complex]VWC96783.1 hypothetical protein BLA9940_05847 [Burkholderia aenigmatica]